TFGEPLEVTMKKFFPDVPVDEAVEIYRSYHRDNFGDLITVFPGMKKLLRQVKERGEKTGLVTSRLAYTTQQGLEKYDLKDYFDVVVTAEDTKKHKPDPEPVNIALKKLHSLPGNSIMLGDTMFDILCAKNAGVTSVLVGWSLALKSGDDFGEDAPDHVIRKAAELLELL
ncbi:MAG: HAD-IA family hydrolase, partial [Clostridia bacterium]